MSRRQLQQRLRRIVRWPPVIGIGLLPLWAVLFGVVVWCLIAEWLWEMVWEKHKEIP